MNKKTKILLASIFLLSAVNCFFILKKDLKLIEKPTETRPKKENNFSEVISEISLKDLKENLEYLASDQLEGRMSGKKGNVLAAEFIKKQFENFGIETKYHKFNVKRMNPGPNNETGDNFTQNIYGWIVGNDQNLKNEIVVIGAHMDHIGYGPSMSRSGGGKIHPGADDNASGTVALIELAKSFSKLKEKVKRTVVFMAFSAEELGLVGSKFYCDNPLFPLEKPDITSHVFMLNMDMIGYLGKGQHTVSFSNNNSSIQIDKIINELSNKYSFAKNITGRKTGGSDHACFYNKKVPIAFLHTGLHPHYHKPSDTADKINYEGLTSIVKYAFELSWLVANNEEKPVFNCSNFEEMELTHDHGAVEFK